MSFNNGFTYEAYQKYLRVFRQMDSMKTFIIATNISELGFPTFDPNCPTASVGLSPNSSRIEYRFNPDFYFKLSDQDLAFVMIHEMLHVTFDHMARFKRLIGDKKPGEYTQEDMQKHKTANIAADCIVNTWAKYLGFEPSDFLTNKETFGLHFPETVGYPDFNSATTMEDIYVFLMNQPKDILEITLSQDTLDSHEDWQDFSGPRADDFKEGVAGSIKEEFFKKVEKSMDSEHLKKLKDQYKDKKGEKGKFSHNPSKSVQYGSQKKGEICHYKLIKDRVQTDVLKGIYQHIKSIYDYGMKETWTRPPKKLISQWPGILLPSDWNQDAREKYDVALFIDASGSITEEMKSQFVRWIRSFPMDKIDYRPISFDTQLYELNKSEFYNPNGYPNIYGGGGTDISLPERYVQETFLKKVKRRPDLIFVLTDGEGSTQYSIPEEYQHTYVWIMVKGGNSNIVKSYCPKGKIIQTNIQ